MFWYTFFLNKNRTRPLGARGGRRCGSEEGIGAIKMNEVRPPFAPVVCSSGGSSTLSSRVVFTMCVRVYAIRAHQSVRGGAKMYEVYVMRKFKSCNRVYYGTGGIYLVNVFIFTTFGLFVMSKLRVFGFPNWWFCHPYRRPSSKKARWV